MEFFLVWIIGGIIVAMIASSKGYSGFGWFLYGCLILPYACSRASIGQYRPRKQDCLSALRGEDQARSEDISAL